MIITKLTDLTAKLSGIPDLERKILSCLQCGYCRAECPQYNQIGWESASPRGKIYYLEQLMNISFMDPILDRRFEVNDKFIKQLFCNSCGLCEVNCHVNIDFPELWEELREWLFENNLPVPEIISGMRSTIDTYHSPYVGGFESGPPTNRNQTLIDKFKLPKKAKVVFFVGCVSQYLLIKILNSGIKTMRKAEVDFTVLADEWCCGNILGTTGQGKSETFEKSAKHNLKAIKETGADTLVTCCPGCYRTFSQMYPKYVAKPDFEVLHFTEFVADLLDKGKIKIKKPLEKTITYHDPCELGRLSGIYEAPRKILESIEGVKLEELFYNKQNCNCCGNGGGFNSLEPEMAKNITFNKIDEVLDTNAETIVSSCPNCRYGISNAIIEKKNILEAEGNGATLSLEMMDITELVGKLGVEKVE